MVWYGTLKIKDIVKEYELMSLKEIENLFEKKHAFLFQEYK